MNDCELSVSLSKAASLVNALKIPTSKPATADRLESLLFTDRFQ
jgi:hypothetical protein